MTLQKSEQTSKQLAINTMGNTKILQHATLVNMDDSMCVCVTHCVLIVYYIYMYTITFHMHNYFSLGRKTSKCCHLTECLPSGLGHRGVGGIG